MSAEKTKLIIKNTWMLYIRMFLTMGITLYTSRVVLEYLGVVDYGIYNVVGGIVTLLSFFNISMVTATQRFLSFELGAGNHVELRNIFSLIVTIQLIFSLAVVVLGETAGLWFLKTQMNFPANRVSAVFWVYQITIISFIVDLLQIPYNAVIIAREKMSVFAYVSILNVVLQLFVVFLLNLNSNRLIFYSILMFLVTLIIFLIYFLYCKRYDECKYFFYWNKAAFNTLISYIGWSTFGGLASVGLYQATNILLNIFFGPAVNAARGISSQLRGAVSSFGANVRVASNPQIIKSYASKDYEYLNKLLFQTTKYSYILMLVLSIPLLVETDSILGLWLKKVPEFTAIFCKLFIVNNLIDCISAPLVTPIQATGVIKKYQIVSGLVLLMNIPLTYIIFLVGGSPQSAIYINIIITVIVLVIRLQILSSLMEFSISHYLKDVVLASVAVTAISLILPYLGVLYINKGFTRLLLTTTTGVAVTIITSYLLMLSANEKKSIRNKLAYFLNKSTK